MTNLLACFYISFGAILGALSRWGLGILSQPVIGSFFWLPTLLVNCIGCFFVGFFWAVGLHVSSAKVWLVIVIGFLGSFTTFSTFALDGLRLFEIGQTKQLMLMWVSANILAITFVFLGSFLGKWWLQVST